MIHSNVQWGWQFLINFINQYFICQHSYWRSCLPMQNTPCNTYLSMISNFLALMKKRGSKLTCQDTVKGTCETTFSCFTYMTSNRKPQYGCVLGETRHLFMCNAGPTTTFVAKCCNEDMCNGRLNLSMPEGGEPKKENSKFVFMRVLDCCPMNEFFFRRLHTFKCYRKWTVRAKTKVLIERGVNTHRSCSDRFLLQLTPKQLISKEIDFKTNPLVRTGSMNIYPQINVLVSALWNVYHFSSRLQQPFSALQQHIAVCNKILLCYLFFQCFLTVGCLNVAQ